MSRSRPNVLFITSHDQGRHLNCYGQQTVATAALDRLADEGVIFDNNYCTAPQCSPSRAALHTGKHAHTVGVLGLAHSPFSWRLAPDAHHVAQRLRQAGYRTALFGVQHLTRNSQLDELGYDQWSGLHAAPRVAQQARSFLQEAAEDERPFYLEVGFFEPHRRYDWGGAQPDSSLGVALPPYIPDTPEATAEFAALQGAIRQLDDGVSVLLEALDTLNLAENTFVIFATDHGLAMPRAKCTLYDPGIAAALLMRWPAGGLRGGRRVEALSSHVDVVPTLLEALSLPAAGLHGRSLWPLLQGQPNTARDAIFAEKTFHTAYEPMRAVRTATHKLIVNFETGSLYDVPDDIRQSPIYPQLVHEIAGTRPHVELYDLRNDPHERDNLASQPAVAEVEAGLRKRLWQWMVDTGDPLLDGPLPSPFYQKSLRWLQSG